MRKYIFAKPASIRIFSLSALLLVGGLSAQTLSWSKFQYGPATQGSAQFGNANAYTGESAMALDGAGNAYVTGSVLSGIYDDWLTIKYNSSGTELWRAVATGSSANRDNARNVRVASSGDVVVAGTTYDYDPRTRAQVSRCTVIKYDANGREIWRVAPRVPTGNPVFFQSACFRMTLDGKDNIILSGAVLSEGNTPTSDYAYVAKLSPSGALLWDYTADGGALGRGQVGGPITTDAFRNVYAASTLRVGSTQGQYGTSISKLSSETGSVVWTFSDTANDSTGGPLRAIAIDQSGARVAVLGREQPVSTSTNTVGTIRLVDTATGILLRKHLFGRPDAADLPGFSSVNSGQFDATGNLYVAGSATTAELDVLIARIDPTNQVAWITVDEQTSAFEEANSLVYDATNNQVVVAGGRSFTSSFPFGYPTGDHIALYADGTSGTVTKRVAIGAENTINEATLSVRLASDSSVLLAGSEFNGAARNYGLVRLDPAGNVQWRTAPEAAPRAISLVRTDPQYSSNSALVDSIGNLYSVAEARDEANRTTLQVTKHGADGATLWTSTYALDTSITELAVGVALDHNEDLIVRSQRVTSASATVSKFRKERGALAWRQIVIASVSSNAYGGLAINAVGDIFLNSSSASGAALVKLANATGDTVWTLPFSAHPALGDTATMLRSVGSSVLLVSQATVATGMIEAPSRFEWRLSKVLDNGASGTIQWTTIGSATSPSSSVAQHLSSSSSVAIVIGTSYAVEGVATTWLEKFSLETGEPQIGTFKLLAEQMIRRNDQTRKLSAVIDAIGNAYIVTGGYSTTGQTAQLMLQLSSDGSETCRWEGSAVSSLVPVQLFSIALSIDGPVATGSFNSNEGSIRMGTMQFNWRCNPLWLVSHDAKDTRETGLATVAVTSGDFAGRVFAIGLGREAQKPQTMIVQAIDRARCTVDLDGNGMSTALNDGLLALRAMLGLSIGSTVQNSVFSSLNDEQLEHAQNLATTFVMRRDYDLDGDGDVLPHTDGIMLLRALLGFTGIRVTDGVIVGTPPRADWSSIRAHMNGTCQTNFGS
jgi:hypothetical protein